MGFYIELPADENGNTAMPAAVIEATVIQGGDPGCGPLTNRGRPGLIITGPPEIASRWPYFYADAYGGYAEAEGPTRMLTREEHAALAAAALAR